MADFGLIKPAFWRAFADASDAEARLGAYLLSNRHRNLEGLYELPLGYVVTDLNWPPEKVTKILAKLVERGFCDYDREAEVVFVCTSLKHHAPKGTPRITGAVRAIERVPVTRLMGPFSEACQRYAPALWEALGRPSPDGSNTPSGPPDGGSDGQETTPPGGYLAVNPPDTDTEADTDPETEPEAAAAREHTREALRIETALGLLAATYGKAAPSAVEIDEVLTEHPDRDHGKALADVKGWAARRPDGIRMPLIGAFRKAVAEAPKIPVSQRAVTVALTAAASDDVEQWEAGRAALEGQIDENTWSIWLAGLTLAGVDGETLVLYGPGAVVGHLRVRYLPLMAEVLGRPVQLIEQAGEAAA